MRCGLLPCAYPGSERSNGVGVLRVTQLAVLALSGESLHKVLLAMCALKTRPVRGLVFDECGGVVDGMHSEHGDRNPPGEIAVIGQITLGIGIGGKALDTRVQCLVVV